MNRPPQSLPAHDILLLGAGHTHLHIVHHWGRAPFPQARLTLVSPTSRVPYSGMLPGTLAGLYQPQEMEIDLYRLTQACGVRLIIAPATGLDPAARQVLLADRSPMRYDIASIGIGSIPADRHLWAHQPRVLCLKPLSTFLDRLQQRLLDCQPAGGRALSVIVVGAGASGFEIACCLEARLRRENIAAVIHLLDAQAEILRGYSPGTQRRAREELSKKGIVLHPGQRVTEIVDDRLILEQGTSVQGDVIIWGGKAAPPEVLEHCGLPCTEDGFLAVRPTLQTVAGEAVFAVGDSASIVGQPLPKAGVYAVREGPVLWENLSRLLAGRPLVPFRPQSRFLSLLSLGEGRALLDYGNWSASGRWVWKLKEHIDRKFLRMYQNVTPASMRSREGRTPASSAMRREPLMRCAGCGGKVGAGILQRALERLPLPRGELDGGSQSIASDPQRDDATILNRDKTPVDLLSVDFFTAFLDDPYFVGRVAALHAMSDLWAMGGEPTGALAQVVLPEGSETQQAELLYQLLAGSVRELHAHGAELWGGHTITGSELTIGFTVAGRLPAPHAAPYAAPHAVPLATPLTTQDASGLAPPLRKGGLCAGDGLLLTKPLGTATLLAGYHQGRGQARWMESLTESLLASNALAAWCARQVDVRGATDITGFGLAGHLWEMLRASGLSARLQLHTLPLLPGFAELSAQGIRSSLDGANRERESSIECPDPQLKSLPAYHALFDPQTSGGLLLAVPAPSVDTLLQELHRQHISTAVVIGQIEETCAGHPPRILLDP